MTHSNSFGLLAIGKSGNVTVEVLDRIDGRLVFSVETTEWSFCFNLISTEAIVRLEALLRTPHGTTGSGELGIGSFAGASVFFIKDDEYADRYFLRSMNDGSLIDLVLFGESVADFRWAVSDLLTGLELKNPDS